jgi:hypothetical protein
MRRFTSEAGKIAGFRVGLILSLRCLPEGHVLLGAVYKALNRLASISDAGPDLHKIRRLPEQPAAPDRCHGNLEQLGDLVLGQ